MSGRFPELKWRLILPAAGVLLVCLHGLALAESDQPAPKPAPELQAVVVEVIGLATMEGGKTIEQAHREALLDARRNALIQAHVVLDVQTQLENLRIKERLMRSQATGYIEQMQVREAGKVPESEPPVYQVRAAALVRPLASFSIPGRTARFSADQWQPVVELTLTSDLPPETERRFGSALKSAMQRCGIAVVPSRALRAGLEAGVAVSGLPGTSGKAARVDWEMGYGKAPGPRAAQTQGPVIGHWESAEGVVPSSASWERLAVLMAQDAVRLWARPRTTTVVFLGLDEAGVAALGRAFGPGAEVRVDAEKVEVKLALAGGPLEGLEPVLKEAGLAGKVKPELAGMTYVVLRVTPADEAAPAEPSPKPPAE